MGVCSQLRQQFSHFPSLCLCFHICKGGIPLPLIGLGVRGLNPLAPLSEGKGEAQLSAASPNSWAHRTDKGKVGELGQGTDLWSHIQHLCSRAVIAAPHLLYNSCKACRL